jgi:hypothetical protein
MVIWNVESHVKVKVTLRLTDSHSVSLGVEPSSGALDQIFFYCLTFALLLLCGALSDERTGLSFVYTAGPCQRSLFRIRVPWYSRPYFTVSDLRLPFSSSPTRRIQSESQDDSTLMFYFLPLKYSVCTWNRRHLSRLHFPLLQFRNNLVA